jgi:hypothetical protein
MSDHARKVAFTGAGALLVGLALLLETHGSRPADRRREEPPPSAVIERAPAPAMSSRTAEAAAKRTAPPRQTGQREREPSLAPTVAPRDRRGAATAARVFLRAYLPYSYGRGSADRIRSAAPPLVRALHDAPPRVPAAVARARPRLMSVLAEAATGDRDVLIVAAVDDGRRRYDVRLTVHHDAGRWAVTEISG